MGISEQDYQKAVAVVMDCSSGSVSNLQRKLYWGYGSAAAAIDRMQDEFIVSSMSASGRRDVYPEETHQLWKELQSAQAVPNLHHEILVKSIIEHVDSHIEAKHLEADLFDKGWNAAMRCVRNNIAMLEAEESTND